MPETKTKKERDAEAAAKAEANRRKKLKKKAKGKGEDGGDDDAVIDDAPATDAQPDNGATDATQTEESGSPDAPAAPQEPPPKPPMEKTDSGDKDDADDGDGDGDDGDGDVGADGTELTEEEKKRRKKEKEKEKKAKKKAKEAEKKEKAKEKKPGKAQVSMIKELLAKQKEEEERARAEAEAEEARLQALEDARVEKERQEKEKKEAKKAKEKERIARQKAEGTYMTPAEKEKLRRQRALLEQSGVVVNALKEGEEGEKKKKPVYTNKKKLQKQPNSKEDSVEEKPSPEPEEKAEETAVTPTADDEDEELSEWDKMSDADGDEAVGEDAEAIAATAAAEAAVAQKEASSSESPEERKERITANIAARKKRNNALRSEKDLRSPIICVLGHVDTGKTSLLDKLRKSNVQAGEAGGITQQIGATQVPIDIIRARTHMVTDLDPASLLFPAFLIIDTPGHESFGNLRSRGSSLCDLAILVVDIMHGLEPQTLESIKLLTGHKKKSKNIPFVVALNKIDRLYGWKADAEKDVRSVIESQKPNTKKEFDERVRHTVAMFAEQGLNACLYWENEDPDEYISMVPTSAHSMDGMGNLMAYLASYSQNQLPSRLAYSPELQCSVLEVKQLPGLGTTIDVILVGGELHYGDTIVVAGSEGPIVTQIRDLMMPQPLKELRVKTPYEHFKSIKAAQGVKIAGKELDKALAGLPLLVSHKDEEVEVLRDEIANLLESALSSIRLSSTGVYVQVEREAQTIAEELGVRIFTADIIYHLEDAFLKYQEELKEKEKQKHANRVIYPAKLKILPQFVFNKRDPIVCGVRVEAGILRVGTPIVAVTDEESKPYLGQISSIEMNNKPVEPGTDLRGQEVCIKIENTTGDAPKMIGRHFTEEHFLVSRITRDSIDVSKNYFRDEFSKADWQLVIELKKILNII